ncbi:hypothetical protein [Winogradskyella sp. A3E31]|uniref:hypothetical protein n=1 Tax=Winogradskyella sp. A3E31 TaxID=3349637 RepID=UPI00398BBA6C
MKKTISARQIIDSKSSVDGWIVFKHDVETNVGRALKMAKIEAEYGIEATYYVQGYLLKDNVEQLKEIAKLGHEVTYHYDVLDANKGNFTEARLEFIEYIKSFERHGFKIDTICPHGNPMMIRSGWNSNKDFFRNKDISKEFNHILDVVVDLPRQLKAKYKYISDAGFKFQIIGNIENNDISNLGDTEISTLKEFKSILNQNKKIIFSTHPHRWRSNIFSSTLNKSRFILIKNVALLASKNRGIKQLLSKFYFLAKKI